MIFNIEFITNQRAVFKGVSGYFLAPSGAQEVAISVRLAVCSGHKLSRILNLHLSGLNLQAILSALSEAHTSSDRRSLKYFVMF